ncbi:Spx/MgsR family RNA polymerase-binding regulatory protein [Paludibacterium yongneupense]|uniref:Spx/MgsR family RNA polymerase-binding regulatory protein n=1 Tax=Paludibacterium yongneupense TaxID=400061 RepID=UPI00040DBA9E|nr:Spx/MgsR family RNA polymerase-binding regulatory protein [Paludibacterium yongneupense]
MITLYGIPNCSSVKKARQWLDDRNIDYIFHDFRKHGVERDAVRVWFERLPDTLINRKGTTWRTLDTETRKLADTPDGAIGLIVAHPTLIKRPLLQHGELLMVGFDEQRYAVELAR